MLSKFTGFKAKEWLQSLSQFGFQSLSGLLVFQIGLILGLVNLRC
ncbi:putative membrane protein [Vibrio cholerae O1 str. EM-1676A]|nr:putative membrane protein [Vibrio cholerae O1 str. EM-1676A]